MGIKVYFPLTHVKCTGYETNPTAPFKGICNQCNQRKIVRNYAYNCLERLGTYCKDCIKEINDDLAGYKDYYEHEEY